MALASVATLALLAFTIWAPGLDFPRIPERQQSSELESAYVALRPHCRPTTIDALREDEREVRREGCETAREQHRIEVQALNQSVRSTNAAEEELRVNYQQTRISFVQSILTVLALAFTGWAAWAATSAASTAGRTLEHADKVMRAELRAYVHVERAELRWGDRGGNNPSVFLFAKNSGQTPAKWFGASSLIFTTPDDEPIGIRSFSSFDRSQRPLLKWSSLGGGAELSFYGAAPDLEVLSEAFKTSEIINIVGVVQYETIFGEICETEFWFTRRGPHRAKFVQPDNVPEGLATFGVAIEEPRAMQRAPVALRTYDVIASAGVAAT